MIAVLAILAAAAAWMLGATWTPDPLPLLLAVGLELLAVPLPQGFFSPTLALALGLTKAVGLRCALVSLTVALLVRTAVRRGNPFLDLFPALLAALSLGQLPWPVAALVTALCAVPLPVLLSSPEARRARDELWKEALALAALGPLGAANPLLAIPVAAGLLAAAARNRDLTRYKSHELTDKREKRGLKQEVQVGRQLAVTVARLRAVLDASAELTQLTNPRDLQEAALKRVRQWVPERRCGLHNLGDPLAADLWSLPCAGGSFHLDAQGLDDSSREAIEVWVLLVQAALERVQAQSRLVQGSRLAAIGQLAAGVAHELNTPLGTLTLAIQMATMRPDTATERLQLAQKAAESMQSIINRLLYYARENENVRRHVSLQEVVNDTLPLLVHSFQLKQVALETWLDETVVLANPGELQQVVLNLLVNALDATPQGGRVRLQVAGPVLTVEDTGPGVPHEVADRIFEPFFTTKPVGSGVGLGLHLSREIAVNHGGDLVHVSGSRFQLTLPAAR